MQAARLHDHVQGVLTTGIEAVVELADSEPFAVLPRELVRCRFPLSDGGDNPSWLLRLLAAFNPNNHQDCPLLKIATTIGWWNPNSKGWETVTSTNGCVIPMK